MKTSLQIDPHTIPAGADDTDPEPVPERDTDSGSNTTENVAVTLFAASIVTVQVDADPVHAPDQPANDEATPGVAVSVTTSPASQGATHTAPQKIPDGDAATVPEPPPARSTVRSNCWRANVAVTLFAASIVTMQLPDPVHAPDQPANTDDASGDADSNTNVPSV